ncbi:hypothetical protein [Pseudaestuariivita sp.]
MQNPLAWLLRREDLIRKRRHMDALRADPHLARDIGLSGPWTWR